MTFGKEWDWGSDVETSKRILDRFLDHGGNFLDTANMYTKGHSEKIIGDHIGRTARRDRVVIATKFLGNMYLGDPNGGGAHRKSLMSACENSLRRLQTDYIDLYWMHFWDAMTPMDETMRALDDLVRGGKVRYIGFSDTPAWKCAEAQVEARFRGWSPVIALQIEYSLLQRTVEGDLMPMAMEMGMGVTPWSPLKGGVLSGKYRRGQAPPSEGRGTSPWVTRHLHEQTFTVIDALITAADEAGCTPAQAALAWVQNRPGVTSTIIGARTVEQLDDNIKALDVVLPPTALQRLDEASKPALAFPHEFLQAASQGIQGGTTIHGRASEPSPLAPRSDAERW